MGKTITTQYSFTACGHQHLEAIRKLRNKLVMLEGQPLAEVYKAFGIVPIFGPKENDTLDSVSIVRTTNTDSLYIFFIVTSTTHEVPHTGLWTNVCRSVFPHARLDVIGYESDGCRFCHSLLVPPGMESEEDGEVTSKGERE